MQPLKNKQALSRVLSEHTFSLRKSYNIPINKMYGTNKPSSKLPGASTERRNHPFNQTMKSLRLSSISPTKNQAEPQDFSRTIHTFRSKKSHNLRFDDDLGQKKHSYKFLESTHIINEEQPSNEVAPVKRMNLKNTNRLLYDLQHRDVNPDYQE